MGNIGVAGRSFPSAGQFRLRVQRFYDVGRLGRPPVLERERAVCLCYRVAAVADLELAVASPLVACAPGDVDQFELRPPSPRGLAHVWVPFLVLDRLAQLDLDSFQSARKDATISDRLVAG